VQEIEDIDTLRQFVRDDLAGSIATSCSSRETTRG
jgi:hypothetical protein